MGTVPDALRRFGDVQPDGQRGERRDDFVINMIAGNAVWAGQVAGNPDQVRPAWQSTPGNSLCLSG